MSEEKFTPGPWRSIDGKIWSDMSEWRDIETAPRTGYGRSIMVAWKGNGYMDIVRYDAVNRRWYSTRGVKWRWLGWKCFSFYSNKKFYPTHWMPLPEPPK